MGTTAPPAASFWSRLTVTERGELHQVGTRTRFEADQPLLSQGDRSRHLVVLLAGSVKATKSVGTGPEQVLALCGPGSVVGEVAALTGAPRSATITALERGEALIVSAEEYAGVARRHPGLRHELERALAHRLIQADERRSRTALPSTLPRLAALLADLADQFADAGAPAVVPITQFDLASLAGSSRSSTARALRRLKAMNLVRTGRGTITVADSAALRDLAGLPAARTGPEHRRLG
ncbi:MAG: Crp/Fnr family transcriptional regulator [Labedaea sp.]